MTQVRAITLVVDDEESVRTLLRRALERGGYHVLTAASGQEALDMMSQDRVEVMLLDEKMPGLSGLDVLLRVHAQHPETAIIMVTGVADVNIGVEAMKMGAHDYVVKPFDLNDILVRVGKGVERRYLTLQLRDYQQNLEDKVAEQRKQLHGMMAQTIQALIKEETLALELKARGGQPKGLPAGTNMKEFGAKLLRRLGGSASS